MTPRFSAAVFALTCLPTPARAGDEVKLEPVWQDCAVQRPVALVIPPDGTRRLFLVEQRGKIRILPAGRTAGEAKTFLDLSGRRMEAGGEGAFEEGLLSLAFHPRFEENRRLFVYYTQQNPKRTVLSEMKVSMTDPDKADPLTERVLLEVPQPFWNHNSGNLLFGPDGYLYLSLGDGGKGGDPLQLAQNPFILNGKILRIDVNSLSGSRQYGIPEDNPFVGKEGVREEIWATGLRNPWGLSIDTETGVFWCADVGQDIWEEINVIVKGGNYGWSWREGAHAFAPRTGTPPEGTAFVEPVIDYPHSEGTSVTGGFVYRGTGLPALTGSYLYGDWGTGRLWALQYDAEKGERTGNRLILEAKIDGKGQAAVKPTAFCPDENGEVLVLDWKGGIHALRPVP